MEQRKFNGTRLKNARLFRGLTLTELADRTNISKQSLSLYENNKNIPEHLKVRKISVELGLPYNFFFQEDQYSVKTETTYFRSLASATKKDRIAQSVKLEYVAKIYEVLLQYLTFPVINLPEIDFNGYDDIFECESQKAIDEIEWIANSVREYWGAEDKPIDNLQYLLEKNGVIVTGFSTNEDKIDAFSQRTIIDGSDIFLIAVALGDRPECRIRFDMAHELGHILLHPWSEDLEAIPKDEFKTRERQANMFASAFLLPKGSYGKDAQLYPTDLEYYQFLKKKWRVSIQAMIYRSHQLGIITDNQYQYLMRQISKNGWRTKEPGDTSWKLKDNIFRDGIELLFEQKILNQKELLMTFRENGVDLYSVDIENLLSLQPGMLNVEDKIVPIIQLKNQE